MIQTLINVAIVATLVAAVVFAALQIASVRREQHIADVALAVLRWRPSRRRGRQTRRGPRDW